MHLELYGGTIIYSYTPTIPGTRIVGVFSVCLCTYFTYEVMLCNIILHAEEYGIFKTEINLLNLHDDPCDETEGQINIQDCIKKGFEKNLNCAIPHMSLGKALPPNGTRNSHTCSSREEFQNYSRRIPKEF